ncbi:PUR-alpha/beta/gamma DNA/RNA-binding protein [Pontibacter sp. HJ8]
MEENNEKAEIYSQRVRAGKRTYFFDVKSTRSNDFYVTITESKRKFKDDEFSYEKHKIFLYKEDFAKFLEALQGTIDHVKSELLTEEALAALEAPVESEIAPLAVAEAEVSFDEELKWE